MPTTDLHISRSWGADTFAPECGCELLPCGHVSAQNADPGCEQHSFEGLAFKTLRSIHTPDNCPATKETND